MDDVYAMEVLRQTLIDACEREKGLALKLEAAHQEMGQLKRRAFVHQAKFRELDKALEVEEAKTNAESLARQKAEETERQHRVEVSEAKRMETIANEHCDAAESEVLRLRKDLSIQRSTTEAADLLSRRLREELGLAEHNGMVAYNQLIAAKAKVCTLQEDLGVATDHIKLLERQARDFGKLLQAEHQQVKETENALSATADELKRNQSKLGDILEKYNDVEGKHIKCDNGRFLGAAALDNERVDVEKQPSMQVRGEDFSSSKHEGEQVLDIPNAIEKTTFFRNRLSTEKKPPIITTEMPALPEPAILRSALMSVTACQVEIFKTTGKLLPSPRANLRNPPRKIFYWLRPDSLHSLFRGISRR